MVYNRIVFIDYFLKHIKFNARGREIWIFILKWYNYISEVKKTS